MKDTRDIPFPDPPRPLIHNRFIRAEWGRSDWRQFHLSIDKTRSDRWRLYFISGRLNFRLYIIDKQDWREEPAKAVRKRRFARKPSWS